MKNETLWAIQRADGKWLMGKSAAAWTVGPGPTLFPRRRDAASLCRSGERPVKVRLVPAAAGKQKGAKRR